MINGRTLRPEDLLKIVRRRSVILIPFLVVSLATFLYVRRLPDRYRSETLILVVPQRVPDSYVRSTVTSKIGDRLQTMNQQILSRTRLEPVIREFNLYPAMVKAGLMEDVVDRMRRDVSAQAIRGDAFRISYTAGDPRTAMRVTEKLASLYIDENLRDREVLADGTNQFLESQLAQAKERLIEHEKKLEDYNRRYSGELPTQVGNNLQVLNNAQMQLQQLGDSMARDRDRRTSLEAIIAENDPDGALAAQASGPGDIPKGAAIDTGPLNAAAVALDTQRKVLVGMEQRGLTPQHPDYVRQKRLVNDLQIKYDQEAAAAALVASANPSAPVGVDRAQIVRLNRVAQARGEIDSITKQLAQKEQDEARLRGVVAEYQRRVEAAPGRESELIELNRDYSTIQGTYASLLRKKEDAQIAANLERYQIGEQFKILDPARLPEKPFSPDRPQLYGIGAAAGLGIGLALAVFLELRDTTLKSDTDVVMALGLPVLALIPELVTDEEKATKRRRRLVASWASAGLAAAAAGVLFWVLK